jgi:hypothetical protein
VLVESSPHPASFRYSLILSSHLCLWEDNIKMDLGEIGFGDVDWINLAQDMDRWRALVNTVMSLRVP